MLHNSGPLSRSRECPRIPPPPTGTTYMTLSTQTPAPGTHPSRPTGEVPVYCDCCPHHPKKMAAIQPDAIQIISRRSGKKHIVRIPLLPNGHSREGTSPRTPIRGGNPEMSPKLGYPLTLTLSQREGLRKGLRKRESTPPCERAILNLSPDVRECPSK